MSRKCLLGFEPDEDASDRNHGGEGGAKFVVACGDATDGFQAGEEVFDAVAFAV